MGGKEVFPVQVPALCASPGAPAALHPRGCRGDGVAQRPGGGSCSVSGVWSSLPALESPGRLLGVTQNIPKSRDPSRGDTETY